MTTRKFNLQPWRAKRRKQQKEQFTIATATVAFVALALAGLNYFSEKKYIEKQENATQILQSEISNFQKAKKQVELIQKLNKELNIQIDTIENLQKKRAFAVAMLDHVAQHTSEDVFLTRLSYDGDKVTILGVAENESSVANFLRQLALFDHFKVPVLTGMNVAVSNPVYQVAEDTEVRIFSVVVKVDVDDSVVIGSQE